MPGEHANGRGDGIGKARQRCDHRLVVPAGKVGTTEGAGEQDVPGEERIVRGEAAILDD